MISYRSNYGGVTQITMRAAAQPPAPPHRKKRSVEPKMRVEDLGPYRDRANCRAALRAFCARVDRPRSDFEIVGERGRFKVIEVASAPAAAGA